MNAFDAVPWPALGVIERLGWVLVHSLWQFAAVGAVTAAMLQLLRHRSSAIRHGVLVLALGAVAAAPLATWLLQPASRPPVLAAHGAGGRATTAAVASGAAESASPIVGSPAGATGPPEPMRIEDAAAPPVTVREAPLRDRVRRALEPRLPWAVAAWCVGVALCSLRPLVGWRVLRRLRTAGLSAPSDEVLAAFDRAYRRLGLRRAVRVSCSTLAKGPLVAGYFRPAILLPVSLVTSIPVSQLEAILAHELAHVRRHDFVVNLLQTLVETLFFYHPAVWWLSRRLRVEREHCCDDLVVSLFDNGPEYGRALIAVERLRGGTPALALGATDGSLLSRIRRIAGAAGGRDARTLDRGQAALLGVAGLSVVAVLALSWSAAARDTERDVLRPVIAELPGGVEVELVGVGFHLAAGEDAEDKGWWRPDGGRLPQPPQLPPGEFTIGDDVETRRRSREFLILIRGLPEDHSVRTDYGVSAAAGSTFADGVWIGHHGAGPFTDRATTRIRVGIATEPYGPTVTIDKLGKKAEDAPVPPDLEAFYGRVAPVGIKSSAGETTLLLDDKSYDDLHDVAAWEIHAVDASGVRHRRSSEAVPPSGPRRLTFAVAAADLDRFEYRLCPYRNWAVFDDVSLEPGRRSDVTVSTESSTPEGDRNRAAAVESVAEPASEPGVVSGQLVDADGSPVSGATVLLRSGGLKKADSDAAGQFRFEGVPPTDYGYEVWAFKDELVTPKVPIDAVPAGSSSEVGYRPLRLEMRPGLRASFVVTAKETGRPVPGATVRFAYPDRRAATTGDDGTASERGLLPRAYEVTVEAEGFARGRQQIDLSTAGDAEYRVALEPGGAVTGVVVDEDGKPVAGAEVLYREEDSSYRYGGDAFRTDEKGGFRHRFLPLNTAVEISFFKEGHERAEQQVVVTAGRRAAELEVTLRARPKGGAVTGRVVDRAGKPVSAARVSNYGSGADPEQSTATDAEGRFKLSDLRRDHVGVRIAVAARGFAPQLLPVGPGTDETPAYMTVTLEPGRSIRGRVVDERRKPVPAAYVMARSAAYWNGLESVRTGADGTFAFDSLPEDVVFQVTGAKRPTTQNMTLALDGPAPVEIVLEPSAVVRGRVVDAGTGRPVPQFRVRADFSRTRLPGDATGSFPGDLSSRGLTFRSDAGRFLLDEVTPGLPLELTVEADGYERAVVERAVASASAAAGEVEVALEAAEAKPATTSPLTVELRDHEGRPAADAQLRLIVTTEPPAVRGDNAFNWGLIESGQLARQSYCERFLAGQTGPDGRFTFEGVAPGRHLQLACWGKGVPADRLLLDPSRAGEPGVRTVTLPAPATVRGTVHRADFPDAESVRLSRLDVSFQGFEARLGPGETGFELADLPPGRYQIDLEGPRIGFTENGTQMWRTNSLAREGFNLTPGENRVFRFGRD